MGNVQATVTSTLHQHDSLVFTTAQTGSTTHLLAHGLQQHVTVHAAMISEQMSPLSLQEMETL